MGVTLADIMAARQVIQGRADATPFLPSPALRARTGQEVLLKLETMQPIGAFKLRGALNAVAALPEGVAGVTCCSTGNHGRAVAYAARMRGVRAVICLSGLVPAVKADAIRALGGEVRVVGRSQDEAQLESTRLCAAEGLVEIPPFDDPLVIAGQGVIGLEMLEARPDLDMVLVPLSGGGLAAGVARAAKAINPRLRVIGVSMERGAAMAASLAAGHPVQVTERPSLADSLGGGVGAGNRHSFAICRALLDEVVLLSEEEIRDAMQFLYFEERLVVEGAAAVGVGALLAGKAKPAGPVATILTGRNPDMGDFTRIINGEDLVLGAFTLKGKRYDA